MSEDEIFSTLSAIDEISNPSETVTMGPFAIFQVEISSICEYWSYWSRYSTKSAVVWAGDGPDGGNDTRAHVGNDDSEPWSDKQYTTAPLALDQITGAVLAQVSGAVERPDSSAATTQIRSDPVLPDTEMMDNTYCEPGLSMPLFRDRQTSRLLYHYMNHVAELLQPVLHPRNPWQTTYFPSALQGCQDNSSCQSISGPHSSASVSLFHSLLSAAAFHLRNATIDSKEFHQLALQHRIKALQALNTVAAHPVDLQSYGMQLTAMLALVTVDTMAGEDSDFPVHLKACYQLQQPPECYDAVQVSRSPIYSICRFLTLLARTTAPVIVARPWSLGEEVSFYRPHFRNDEKSVEHIYGITPTLGNMLAKTCKIAEHLAFYDLHGRNLPQRLRDACEALGTEILSWTIDLEPFSLPELDKGTMREIARCQARAFHKAVLIYYHRTVQKHGMVRDPTVDVDDQVQAVWRNLTEAEDLKDAYTGGVKRSAPMSWPAFIAACEATDRQCWTAWWERVSGYCIGNFTRQWHIIQELWSIQDAREGRSMSWRDALAQTGRLILPI